ncbi:MAG: SDR family NAD(P)-dependent oxidoreductase [Acidimicrobiia bacterium]
MKELRGRTAVITGAAGGIGAGIAHALGEAGMNLVLADIEADPLVKTTAEIDAYGVRTLAVPTDVADRGAVAALADAAHREMGRVDVLCSNAGVGAFPPIAEATASDWDWVMSVNLGGMINCLLAFLPRMKDQDGEKHIVLTASIAGLAPLNMTIYSTTKYAIVGMGESLAQESHANGYGIGVSVLCPGGVLTNFGTSDRNRPDRANTGLSAPPRSERSRGSDPDSKYVPMDPRDIGVEVRHAIVEGDLYIVPHAHTRDLVDARHARIVAAYDKAASGGAEIASD